MNQSKKRGHDDASDARAQLDGPVAQSQLNRAISWKYRAAAHEGFWFVQAGQSHTGPTHLLALRKGIERLGEVIKGELDSSLTDKASAVCASPSPYRRSEE